MESSDVGPLNEGCTEEIADVFQLKRPAHRPLCYGYCSVVNPSLIGTIFGPSLPFFFSLI